MVYRTCAQAFVRSTEGVRYDSIDSQPVRLIFVLLVPENSAGLHLKALARISRVLKDREFRDELIAAGTSRDPTTYLFDKTPKI